LADTAMNPTKYRPTVVPGQLSRATDYGQGGIWRGDGGHVPDFSVPSHWFSNPWVGCL